MFATSITSAPTGDELHTEIRESIERLLVGGHWASYQATVLNELRDKIANQVGVSLVRLCASGSMAMELALRGCDLKPGDEVICPALDYPGNIRAVRLLGAIPVIVDCDPGGWTIGVEQLELARSSHTRAVIASHLYGEAADIAMLRSTCHQHDWLLIEDACQMPGGKVADRALGSFGDVAAFSFGGSKPLTAGCGGAVVTNDTRIMQRIASYVDRPSDALSISPLQAAVLLPQWRRLDALVQRQQQSLRKLVELCQPVTPNWRWPVQPRDRSTPSYYKIPLEILAHAGQEAATITLRRSRILELLETANLSAGLPFRVVCKAIGGRGRMIGFQNAHQQAQKHFLLDHRHLAGPSERVTSLAAKLIAIHDDPSISCG